jgi:hypothetical protein
MAAVKPTGEPKRTVIVRPPRQVPPVPRKIREACLRVLAADEGIAMRAGAVAELAGTSPALAGRALRELAADHEVEHAEGVRGIVGPLVRRDGDLWAATELGREWLGNALNHAADYEAAGEQEVGRADESEAERAVRELEREVEALRARLAEVEGDASFDVLERVA